MTLARRATAALVAAAMAVTSVLPMSSAAEAAGRHAKNRGHAVQGYRAARRASAPRRRHAARHRAFRPRVHRYVRRSGPRYVAPRRVYRRAYAGPVYYSAPRRYYDYGYYYDDAPYYYRRKRRNNVGKAIAIGAGLIALGIIASQRGRRGRW